MWPFITCGRNLSVMISLHSKPSLGKENTAFDQESRKSSNSMWHIKGHQSNPLIKLCKIRCSLMSRPALCLLGITGIIWSVFWMRGRAPSPVDLLLLPPHPTTANTHQRRTAAQTLRTVRHFLLLILTTVTSG